MGGELYNDHHKVFWVEVGDKVGLAYVDRYDPYLRKYPLPTLTRVPRVDRPLVAPAG